MKKLKRTNREGMITDEEGLERLKQFTERLGYIPTSSEIAYESKYGNQLSIGKLPSPAWYIYRFGSYIEAQKLAGIRNKFKYKTEHRDKISRGREKQMNKREDKK